MASAALLTLATAQIGELVPYRLATLTRVVGRIGK